MHGGRSIIHRFRRFPQIGGKTTEDTEGNGEDTENGSSWLARSYNHQDPLCALSVLSVLSVVRPSVFLRGIWGNLRNLWMHSSPTRPHLTTGGEPAEGMGLPPSSAAEKAAFRCRRAWREKPPGPYATWACAGQGYRLTWTRTAKRTGSPGRARGNGAFQLLVLGRLPDGTAMTSWALQRPSSRES